MMMKQIKLSSHIQNILQELKLQLQKLYGDRLTSVVLYGSVARGEATANSDIDVLVVLRDEVSDRQEIAVTSHLISSLSLEYNVTLSRVFVPVRRYLSENSPFFLNVRREGVVL